MIVLEASRGSSKSEMVPTSSRGRVEVVRQLPNIQPATGGRTTRLKRRELAAKEESTRL